MIAPTNDKVLDAYIEWRNELQRWENAIVREILELQSDYRASSLGSIADGLAQRSRDISSPLGLGPNSPRGIRLRNLIARETRKQSFRNGGARVRRLKELLNEVGRMERKAWLETVNNAIPSPARGVVQLDKVPLDQISAMVKDSIGERLEGSAAKLANELRLFDDEIQSGLERAVLDGLRSREGMGQIVARARKVHDVATWKLSAIVRQQVMRTANDVAAEMHRANRDAVKGEQYVATLDSGTCEQCGPLDGKVYLFDGTGGAIRRPPLHPNCRCFTSPVVKSHQEMGIDGDKLPKWARDALDGKQAPRKTWPDWVMAKKGRLENVVGPTKAKMVRDGKIGLSDLTTRTEVRTIEQLQKVAA